MRKVGALLALMGVAFAALPACEEKPKPKAEEEEAEDAGAQGPVIGGKLGEAVKAASSAGPAASAAPEAMQGPPPGGIFAPGEADKQLAAGSAPKVELVEAGAEPRVSFARAGVALPEKHEILLGLRTGQPFPPVEFSLSIDKPKSEDGEAGDDTEKPAAEPGSLVATMDKVALAGVENMALPKELVDAIGAFSGSTVSFGLTPSGPIGMSFTAAEDSQKGLANILWALQEVMSSTYMPPPPKPVGVGGFWIVTDRISSFGIDVARYRVFKVDAINDKEVRVTVDIRQYAATDTVALPEAQGTSLGQYEATGKARLVVPRDSHWPSSLEVQTRTMALLLPPGAKNQPPDQRPQGSPLMVEVQARSGDAFTPPPGMPGPGSRPPGMPPGGMPPGMPSPP